MPQRLVGDHEAADVLRQVPRAAAQHVRDRQHACDKWVFHVETRFAQTLFHRRFAVAPAVTLRKQRDLVGRKAEGLGDVAHRALAAVADPGGSSEERRVGKEWVSTCRSRGWAYP